MRGMAFAMFTLTDDIGKGFGPGDGFRLEILRFLMNPITSSADAKYPNIQLSAGSDRDSVLPWQ